MCIRDRTYTVVRQNSGSDKHPGADICEDSTCCQAYIEREAALARWGLNAQEYEMCIRDRYYTKCIVAPLERVEVRDMNEEFSRTLSLLRQERGVSQRTAAGALGISQALLSHYENGIREPGLAFVVRACDYYGVSADFLLGRTLTRDGTTIAPEELYDLSDEKDNSMRGSVLALLSKKLLVNSVGMLFDLLGKTGSREAIRAASNYLSTAVYKAVSYTHLFIKRIYINLLN